jgi:hypothetical protein
MLDARYLFRLTDYKQNVNKNQELLARVNKNQYVRNHGPPEAETKEGTWNILASLASAWGKTGSFEL